MLLETNQPAEVSVTDPKGARRSPFLAALVTVALTLSAVAGAQALPQNSADAMARGERAMETALATYDAQYPDRPLWQDAIKEGRLAVSLAPGNPAPLRFLAEVYSRSNWPGPAVRTWNQFIAAGGTLDPEARELYLEDANGNAYEAYVQGELETAAELYRAVTRAVPDDVEAYRWLGRILLELKAPEQAVSAWVTVNELEPGDSGNEYWLQFSRDQATWGVDAATEFYDGVAAYERGDLTAARNAFSAATAFNASYTEAWAWLGRTAFETNNYADAYRAYSRAVSLEPGNSTYTWFQKESDRLR